MNQGYRRSTHPAASFAVTIALCAAAACSGDEPKDARPGASGATALPLAGNGSGAGGGGGGWSSGPGLAGAGAGRSGTGALDPDADGGAPGEACAKQTARATRQPVYLAFAFDVSGSMGKGDKPWHDRALKWDPVVSATQAFFEDAKSEGFSASLTFFPAGGGEDARCEAESYRQPDVAMTALPSEEFGRALAAMGMEEWRGGTPTLHVVQGVFDQIAAGQMTQPGRYALVLVTDGYPQDCDDDEIENVAALVQTKAGEIPTYVIGVANPPIEDAPDVTTNLADIAKAGGTGNAYVIDTGNPAQTVADFKKTIDTIRSSAVSCNLPIPAAPAGQTFDKKKVSVKYSGAGTLAYDGECKAASSWHYDSPDQPTEIVLCPDTCKALQMDEAAELAVDFECEQVILGPL